jgi:4-carboxymuconolactone decarboxylase
MTNTTPRFPHLPVESLSPEQKVVYDKLVNGPRKGIRGPFGALLRNPTLADRVSQLGDSVRFESSLPDTIREMMILMVARFFKARYEWHAHGMILKGLGFADDKIEAIGRRQRPNGLTEDETIVFDFVTELLNDGEITDPTFDKAKSRFGEITVLDILATAGYFGFVSMILNAIRLQVPEGGMIMPED